MPKLSRDWLLASLSLLLLAGCQQTVTKPGAEQSAPPGVTHEQKQLARSLETWQQLKAEKGEHYRYKVSAGSVFGPSYDTTLTVKADRVVQRDLAVSQIDDEGNTTIVESWSETGDALGTHDDGAELITVDERYGRCKNDVLSQNPVNNDIYLAFQDNGVLRDCSYVPKGAAYDGGSPVIVSLEFLPIKPD